ncbi:cytochrome c3 family protein [Maribacter halichondriae]|uniref:cytochrome c3 family protein n=1 Tax=Maribacter halichondriae TaxID=2980554 RepID=UPI0023593F07|nr:cytochrome c3 family protein [Maribacter sp. Hal144]
MKKKGIRNIILFLVGITVASFVWHCKNRTTESDYFTPKVLATHATGGNYVGSETCMECHADIYETHIGTAHYNTSAVASSESIKGSFDTDSNTIELQDARLTLHSEDGAFFQKSDFKYGTHGQAKEVTSKLDVVIGSGVKGQSYLSWEDDRLFQLQASYYTPIDNWVNAPGFPVTSFKRPITDACLKCHVTFAKNHDPVGNSNQFVKDQLFLGIDCERCHGPLEKHVLYQRGNPSVETPEHIIKIDSLSRQQRLDICAQCHSGLRNRQIKGNPFDFLPGEHLDEYSKNYNSGRPKEKLDVHGNQYGLLTSSQCFIKSPDMDCTTCHNPHKNQRGDMASFNKICMECHASITKGCTNENTTMTTGMNNDCIACHMPLSPSSTMQVQLNTDSLAEPVYIRTHLIDIYE